jgi:hypothetical protein
MAIRRMNNMTTRNIVPQAAGEGGIGTQLKPWGKVFAKEIAGSPAFAGAPNFTGTPTAPTAAKGTNTAQIATTAFVGSAVNAALSQNGGTLLANKWLRIASAKGLGRCAFRAYDAWTVGNRAIAIDAEILLVGTTNVTVTKFMSQAPYVTDDAYKFDLKMVAVGNEVQIYARTYYAYSLVFDPTKTLAQSGAIKIESPFVYDPDIAPDDSAATYSFSQPGLYYNGVRVAQSPPTGVMPRPLATAVGIGQYARVAGSAGAAVAVPAGGTWLVAATRRRMSDDVAMYTALGGIVAGGTSWTAAAGYAYDLECWRIA